MERWQVICSRCHLALYQVYGEVTGVYQEGSVILCKTCAREKDEKELQEIARMSTEQVMKEISKVDNTEKDRLV